MKEGADVFTFGRRQEALDKAVKLIGGNLTAIQADASKLKDLDRVADTVRKAKGRVDVVVSNAGFTEQVPVREITEEHFDRTFNLMAIAFLQVLITGGYCSGLGLALRVLGLEGQKAWTEDPGFPFTRRGLELAMHGFTTLLMIRSAPQVIAVSHFASTRQY